MTHGTVTLIIQQIYKLLSILNSYTQEEREELLLGYQCFLFETKDRLIALDRIVGGSTYWGWKIEWGYHPWHLMTYRQQKGLTLQAGRIKLILVWICIGHT